MSYTRFLLLCCMVCSTAAACGGESTANPRGGGGAVNAGGTANVGGEPTVGGQGLGAGAAEPDVSGAGGSGPPDEPLGCGSGPKIKCNRHSDCADDEACLCSPGNESHCVPCSSCGATRRERGPSARIEVERGGPSCAATRGPSIVPPHGGEESGGGDARACARVLGDAAGRAHRQGCGAGRPSSRLPRPSQRSTLSSTACPIVSRSERLGMAS